MNVLTALKLKVNYDCRKKNKNYQQFDNLSLKNISCFGYTCQIVR